ncbi:negative regulator of systemic acquired resistance SNI1 isoform X1 [Cryptomeria japonica]|uniref:negative regulator of systemic acquired resistance SNI1 isoform X1 n=1 Tax=Cryptomeria japonica TaxID=3369 RepID=UPI0027D9E1AF|nr:negative regulator of systemic acquired resistance SNI1 isoform X1 [Cryptomeria japonica]XP_057856044.2 negative regulator of systemic acquired resistance SNI1 isoform X1 [Cryptomeria japonica]
MEKPNGIRTRLQPLPEENIMAILDLIGVKDQHDIEDDKLTFLSAVRAISIVPQVAQVPTRKMYEAVFQILQDNRSLELTITSYQLLQDLEKCFPRVSIAKVEGLSSTDTETQLVINSEVWSPFGVSLENDSTEMEGHLSTDDDYIDFSKLLSSTQDIVNHVCDGDPMYLGKGPELNVRSKQLTDDIMSKMMMFQYLVTLLRMDFISRCQVFKSNQKWPIIRNSFLNQLLGSQRANFKNLVKNLMRIVAATTREDSAMDLDTEHNSDCIPHKPLQKPDLADTEFRHTLSQSVETLLTLVMELDTLKKEANQNRWTSRSDGSRTPVLEIVIDELSYNKELISPYLQGTVEAKWKTNIILTFFSKHCPRSIKMFERNIDESTIIDIFNCFSNVTNVRIISKRMGEDVIQLLLVHGFQAYFSLQQGTCSLSHVKDNAEGETLLKETCKSFITSFRNLKRVYKELELVAGGREALFTAATIMS